MSSKKSKTVTSKHIIKHKYLTERTKSRNSKEKLMKEGLRDEKMESWTGSIKTEE